MGEVPNNNPQPQGYYPTVTETNRYALSGKIMLSAIIILFTVVVLVVCLHIYARWYLARYRRQSQQLRGNRRRTPHIIFISDLSTSAATFSHGLEASVLNSLPTFVYSRGAAHAQECAVCLSEFEENEKGRLLPKCNHSFHTECIDMWFATHSTCPLCRSAVVGSEFHPQNNENNHVRIAVDCPDQVGPSASTSRLSANLGLSIELPRRNESFKNQEDEVQESPLRRFISPGGRILSLRRIMSRESRPSTPMIGGGGGGSHVEIDLERGEVEHRLEPTVAANEGR